jgi:hypothetical protein
VPLAAPPLPPGGVPLPGLGLFGGGGDKSRSEDAPAPQPSRTPEPQGQPTPQAPVEPAAHESSSGDSSPQSHFLSFAAGGLLASNPIGLSSISTYHGLGLFWTPTFPLPILSFLYLRGNLGVIHSFDAVSGAPNGISTEAFPIQVYQAFAGTTLLRPLYAEVGVGGQHWDYESASGTLVTLQAGLILSMNGFLNRVFVGVSSFKSGDSTSTHSLFSFQNNETHLGIGFQL